MSDEATARWWRPERLTAVLGERPVHELRYVVLEEVVDHVAVLQAWPWPLVDEQGRLHWRQEQSTDGPLEVAALLTRLQEQCYRRSMVRHPRSGDTFAAVVAADEVPAEGLVDDLRRVFPEGLYDLSAEAHQAAKLAYQGALAAIGPPEGRSSEDRVLLRGRAPHITLTPPGGDADGRVRR